MAAVEVLLDAEHVHRAALALGQAAATSGEFRHHTLGVHAASQHMAVVAIARDHLVTRLRRHLHADDHRFLADVEVAEPADEAHAIHLAGLLLETPDHQHFAIGLEILLRRQRGGCLSTLRGRLRRRGHFRGRRLARARFGYAGIFSGGHRHRLLLGPKGPRLLDGA